MNIHYRYIYDDTTQHEFDGYTFYEHTPTLCMLSGTKYLL